MGSYRIRRFLPFLAAVVTLLAVVPGAHAADVSSATMHVRTNEPDIATLIREAMQKSPSFRLLVERLNSSDVIVYVRSVRQLPPGVDGHLTFMGVAGGRRYVVVSLDWGRSRLRQTATLGHELQHAVEIAERRDIVDSPSMQLAYEGFGEEGDWRPKGRSFDTAAAIQAGDRIWKEMQK
jgi:hypothetical protein